MLKKTEEKQAKQRLMDLEKREKELKQKEDRLLTHKLSAVTAQQDEEIEQLKVHQKELLTRHNELKKDHNSTTLTTGKNSTLVKTTNTTVSAASVHANSTKPATVQANSTMSNQTMQVIKKVEVMKVNATLMNKAVHQK